MQFHSIKSLFKKLYAPYESNITAAYEDAGILNLTEQEITGLNEYQRQVKDIESKALSMANDLIAYAGANYILGVIKKSVLDNKTANQDGNSAEIKGLLAFCDVHNEVIKLVCDELFERINNHEASDSTLYPVQHLEILIPKTIMQGIDCSALRYVVDKSPADVRNSIDNSNKIKLFACNSDEDSETLENVPKVDNNALIQAIIDNVFKYMSAFAQAYGIAAYQKGKGADHLKNTLLLLKEHDEIDLNIYNLAKFVCITWLNMNNLSTSDAMRKALGKSLYVMSFPSQSGLFSTDNLNKAYKDKYRKVINDIVKGRGSLRSCTDTKGNRLKYDSLLERYQQYFVADEANTDKSDSSFKSEKISDVMPFEHALIKRYILSVKDFNPDNYKHVYNDLCHIEWSDRLSKLFDAKAEKRTNKKSLWERTEEHFKQHKQNEAEDLNKDEAKEISLIMDLVSNHNGIEKIDHEDVDKLFDFVQNHKRMLSIDPKLLKEWNDLIFSNNKYEDDNFMLSLTKCIVYACGCSFVSNANTEKDTVKTAYIELRLDETQNSMLSKNYVAIRYFSMRFGAYLKYLEEQLHLKFFVTSPNRKLPLTKDGKIDNALLDDFVNSRDTFPIMDYNKFYESAQVEQDAKYSTKVGKDFISLKFIVIHKSTQKNSDRRYKITWTYRINSTPVNLAPNLEQILNFSTSETTHPECGIKLDEKKIVLGSYQHQQYTITGKQAPLDISSPASFVLNESGAISFESSGSNDSLTNKIQNLLDECQKRAREYESSYDADAYITNDHWDETLSLTAKIDRIKKLFKDFHDAYFMALKAMYDSSLLYSEARKLSDRYTLLQNSIIAAMDNELAPPDIIAGLRNILNLVMMVGFAYEKSSSNNVIASPFTVESMRSYTAKLERLSSIICAAANGDLNLSQINMFIESLSNDMAYIDAPEACLRLDNNNVGKILFAKEEVAGYALYDYLSDIYSQNKIALPVKDYTNAILEYLRRYVQTRPYEPSQCTLMVRDCRFPELLVGIYLALRESEFLSNIALTLLIVNDEMHMTVTISKVFEQLRTSELNEHNNEAMAKRVHVTILSSQQNLKANATLSNYLNHNNLKFNGKTIEVASNRIADITILMHMFDEDSIVEYDDFPVGLLSDEVNAMPSLVNRYNTGKKRSEQVCKFLVNQVQPLSRIQYFNSIWLFSKEGSTKSNLKDFLTYNNAIAKQASSRLNHGKFDETALHAYLPNRIVSRSLSSKNMHPDSIAANKYPTMDLETKLKNIHSHSEVVAFIDELQCRNLVRKKNDLYGNNNLSLGKHASDEERRVVFYNKLKNSRVNLLVSSSAERHNTERHLRKIFENTCQNRHEYANDFISAVEADAVDISGSMLLRAENRRKFSYELMGNVMSKFLMEQILTHMKKSMQLDTISALSKPLFLSLDDYQQVLIGKSASRADILCLHVVKYANSVNLQNNQQCDSSVSEGIQNQYLLLVSVIESKFLQDFTNTAATQSADQAQKSLQYLSMPLLNDFADRRLYLAKFADMLADNYQARSPNEYEVFSKIQTLIREEQIDIMFSGYSFVFVINKVNDTEEQNKNLQASFHPSSKDNSNEQQRIIQLHIHHDPVSKIMEAYTDDRCCIKTNAIDDEEGSQQTKYKELQSSTNVLEEMLEADGMYLLKEYLDIKHPQIIKLKPHKSLVLTDSSNTKAASVNTKNIDSKATSSNTQAQAPNVIDQPKAASHDKPRANTEDSETNGSNNDTIDQSSQNRDVATSTTKDTDHGSNNNTLTNEDKSSSEAKEQVDQKSATTTTPRDDTNGSAAVSEGDSGSKSNYENSKDTALVTKKADATTDTNDAVDHSEPKNSKEQQGSASDATSATAKPGVFKPMSPFFNKQHQQEPVKENEVATSITAKQTPKDISRQELMNRFFAEHIKVKEYLDSCTATVDFENPKNLEHLDEFIHQLIKKLNKGNVSVRKKRITTSGGYVELSGDETLTTKSISALHEYMLTQHGFDITDVAAISKAIAIRVEFKDFDRIFVPYEAMLKDREFNYDTYTIDGVEYLGFNSRFILGIKDDDGSQMYLDLRRDAPHTLIAGGTSSGKSTIMKMMIMDMILTNLSSELRVILIDPKDGVELGEFKDLPNVGVKNFPSQEEYQECFNSIVDEMEQRYKYMSQFRQLLNQELGDDAPPIPDIDEYNKFMAKYFDEHNKTPGFTVPVGLPLRMDHVIMVIDEFADITLTEGKSSSIETLITRLGNKARAAGIFLVLATQRPSVKVVDGSIKANTGNRICLKVASRTETMIALGDRGSYDASKLAGKGHMIAKLGGEEYMIQGAYMSSDCLVALRKAIRADYELRLACTQS